MNWIEQLESDPSEHSLAECQEQQGGSNIEEQRLPSVLGLVDRLYEKNHLTIEGGNGWCEEDAIFIDAPSPRLAVAAEYFVLYDSLGLAQRSNRVDGPFVPPWYLEAAMFLEQGGGSYEILTIVLGNGERATLYFDVTALCRSGMTPKALQELHAELHRELKIYY